jgi:hypothetical protein
MAHADVWKDSQLWNDEWETKFSNWMKTPSVHKEMFVSTTSLYKGVIADCADVAYAFRIIFAFENSLAFSAKNPMATAKSELKVFSNKMTRFDNIKDPHQRVVAFINYLGKSVGTETLAANDTYPMKLATIRAGDVFLYKQKKNNEFVRHNFNLKNIDKRGNTEVIYSTQAVRDKAGAPLYQKVQTLPHAPITYKWGFRRYNYGESLDKTRSTSYKNTYSDEQYALATTLGDRAFFAHVKSLLRLEVEDPDAVITRGLKEVCDQVKERIDIVDKGVAHQKALGGKCMDYADFDAHSTPSRDGSLKDLINNLELDYKEFTEAQKKSLSGTNLTYIEALYGKDPSAAALDSLKTYCPISYKLGTTVSLRDIRVRISKNLLSSHPNDLLEVRWGEKSSGKTKCKAFY